MSACLEIRRLSAVLPNRQRVLRSVSLAVQPGEVRALVGESGAGKTMIGKAVLGVLPSSVRVVEGDMLLEGEDLGRLDAKVNLAELSCSSGLLFVSVMSLGLGGDCLAVGDFRLFCCYGEL